MAPTDEIPDPDDHPAWDITRKRGVLSPKDRAFLLEHEDSGVNRTEEGVKTGSERSTRLRIRNRIYHAFLDFTLIYQYLPEKDRELIFDNPHRSDDDELELWSGAIHTLAFLYERLSEDYPNDNFEYSLQAAILTVLGKPGMARHDELDVLGDVMVNIDTSRVVDLGHIGEKIGREGYLALNEDELEAIEVLVNSKSDEELHPGFKEDLLADVERARKMDDSEKEARLELGELVVDELEDAVEDIDWGDVDWEVVDELKDVVEDVNWEDVDDE